MTHAIDTFTAPSKLKGYGEKAGATAGHIKHTPEQVKAMSHCESHDNCFTCPIDPNNCRYGRPKK